jgi:hypothetical protein
MARSISTKGLSFCILQGAELKVLRGASDMLSQGRVSMIYSEILIQPTYELQATMEGMLSLLRGHGYALHDLQNLSHTNATLAQLDAVFLKR